MSGEAKFGKLARINANDQCCQDLEIRVLVDCYNAANQDKTSAEIKFQQLKGAVRWGEFSGCLRRHVLGFDFGSIDAHMVWQKTMHVW